MVPTIAINLAYVALVGSTLTRTAVQLRSVILLGSIGFVAFGLMEEIYSMVIWNAIISVLHLVNLGRIFRRRRARTVDLQAEWFRQVVFGGIPPSAFNALWASSSSATYNNQILTRQGVRHGRLAVITDGVIEVQIDGRTVSRLGPGAMVGEMSLLSGSAATATTRAVGQVSVREWQRSDLGALGDEHPEIGRSVEQAALRSVVYKMQVAGQPSPLAATMSSATSTIMSS